MNNKSDRAKQFMPFDALNGFREVLKEAEIEYEEKRDLSEDSFNELEIEFKKIEIGSYIKINYYNYKKKKYDIISGIVTDISYIKKKIQVDYEFNVNILDIINLQIN